jgi:diacylglycerol O-acyltransferase / wax synthase
MPAAQRAHAAGHAADAAHQELPRTRDRIGGTGANGVVAPSTERLWTDSFAGDAGAVITNVVGPRHAVSMAGTPLHTMVLWVPCTGAIGLGISLFSYDGRATIGLIADTAVTSDLGALTAALNDELEALDDGAPPRE